MSNRLDPDQARHIVILSGMVWVQTVCKSYQQVTLYSRQTQHQQQSVDDVSSIMTLMNKDKKII